MADTPKPIQSHLKKVGKQRPENRKACMVYHGTLYRLYGNIWQEPGNRPYDQLYLEAVKPHLLACECCVDLEDGFYEIDEPQE